MRFGDYLRGLREAKKINLSEFQRRTGCAYTTVNNWEKHGVIPDTPNFGKIVTALEATPEEAAKLHEYAEGGNPDALDIVSQDIRRGKISMGAHEQKELESLLGRALDQDQHTIMRAAAVFETLRSRADLLAIWGKASDDGAARAARILLDAASLLHRQHHEINAEALVFAVAALAANTAVERDYAADLKAKLERMKAAEADLESATREDEPKKKRAGKRPRA